MYKDIYETLVSKVGKDAAKAGVRSQYADLGLALIAIVEIIISNTSNPSWFIIGCLLGVFFFATVINIYTRILFARSVSDYLGTKVGWLGLPLMRPKTLEEWLESVKQRSQSSNKHNQH